MAEKKNKYTEPVDFIPKEIRKKLKLGEFAENPDQEKAKANKEIRDYVNGKK